MPQTEQDSRERTAKEEDRGPRAARMSPQNVQVTTADAERVKSDGRFIVVWTLLSIVIIVVIGIGLLNDEPWAEVLSDLLSFLGTLGS